MSNSKTSTLLISTILSAARSRGLWYGLTLSTILLRSWLRRWFGEHHRKVSNAAMLGLLSLGAWVLGAAIRATPPTDPLGLASVPIIIAFGLAAVAVGLGHFVLQPVLTRQVWMRCLNGLFVAACVAGLGYAAYDEWRAFYTSAPAPAVYVALLCAIVVFGFRDVFVWFLRSVLIRDTGVLDLADVSSLTPEGRHRVAIHEAGHAICYGLTTAVPEDAYVCIDTDLNSLIVGSVTIPTPKDPTEVTKERLEWSMLMTMAGVAAEHHFFGEKSLSGSGDIASMSQLATAYLSAGHGEVFDPAPADELGLSANRAAIGRLRDHYASLAEVFIQANHSLCEEMARLVEKDEFVDCTSIAGIVGSVALPEGWKRTTWAASVPTIPFQ